MIFIQRDQNRLFLKFFSRYLRILWNVISTAYTYDRSTLFLYRKLDDMFSLYTVIVKTIFSFPMIFHRSSANMMMIKFQHDVCVMMCDGNHYFLFHKKRGVSIFLMTSDRNLWLCQFKMRCPCRCWRRGSGQLSTAVDVYGRYNQSYITGFSNMSFKFG
jgi:hypothetical protein